MPTSGRPEAADSIWNWREADAAPEDLAPRARRRGVIRGAVALIAAGVFWLLGAPVLAAIVAGLGSLTFLAALLSPLGLYAVIERLLVRAASAIGRLTTYLTMVPLFYFFFVPFGAIFRRAQRDKLKRFFDPDAESYWTVRSEPSSGSWERQY